MTLEDTIRALVPGITAEHLSRTVDEVRAATARQIAADSNARVTERDRARGRELAEAHGWNQPTPQVGDKWESSFDDLFTVTGLANGMVGLGDGSSVSPTTMRKHWRLVERNGKSWPPAQEQEPAREAGVEPATDDEIAKWEEQVSPCEEDARRFSALVARVRQEQARAENAESFIEMLKGQRGEAQRERDEAVARAEAAEAALARVERVTALERAVVAAAKEWEYATYSYGMGPTLLPRLRAAVRALRDAQEVDQ